MPFEFATRYGCLSSLTNVHSLIIVATWHQRGAGPKNVNEREEEKSPGERQEAVDKCFLNYCSVKNGTRCPFFSIQGSGRALLVNFQLQKDAERKCVIFTFTLE